MARAGSLSGGNLQKALLARELAFDPAVLIAAQPTRGLDIGATGFVHEKFLSLRAKGCGLVVISEDLDELLTLSRPHRRDVRGHDRRRARRADATVQRIGLLMSGVKEAA